MYDLISILYQCVLVVQYKYACRYIKYYFDDADIFVNELNAARDILVRNRYQSKVRSGLRVDKQNSKSIF